MKKITLLGALLAGAMSFAQTTFDFNGTTDGFVGANATASVSADVDGTSLLVTTAAGTNGRLNKSGLSIVATSNRYVIVDLKPGTTTDDVTAFRVLYTTSGSFASPITAGTTTIAGDQVVIDCNGWTGTVTNFQLQLRVGTGFTITNAGSFNIDKITFTNTLSSNVPTKLAGVSVNAKDGAIVVAGAKLDAVYNVAGQKVATEGLSSGIYLVKVSNAQGADVIKVVL